MNSGLISLTAGDLRFEQGHLVMADYVAQAEPKIIGSFFDAELPGLTVRITGRMTPPTELNPESATVQAMQTLTTKMQSALTKYEGSIAFEPNVGEHGMFYMPGQKLLVAVVYDYIAGGYTDQETADLLGLPDPTVVATAREFINELL